MTSPMFETTTPILIAGPTASGKSALALALAETYGGVIINADSMQVYRELEVLTARPAKADLARAPHALYGTIPATEAYSVGRFVTDAKVAIHNAQAAGLRPIIVGGTGLYFKALTEGLSPIPAIDAAVRARWRQEAERIGAEALHDILSERDTVMAARLRPSDPQRIVRALEVLESTGKSLAHWQTLSGEPVIDEGRSIRFVLEPDRESLHAQADTRFDAMVANGGLDEARRMKELQLSPDLPAMRAIGVAPLVRVIRGEQRLADAIEDAKADTRQYIKRQQTWLRRNMIAWNKLSEKQIEKYKTKAITFIQHQG